TLGPALQIYGRTVDASKLVETYDVRDYCVQYRESLLEFACRLMQEEGIAFMFVHDEETRAEVLVLADDGSYPEVATLVDPEIPIIADRPDTAVRESLRYFDWCRSEHPAVASSRGFNWKDPASHPTGDGALEHP